MKPSERDREMAQKIIEFIVERVDNDGTYDLAEADKARTFICGQFAKVRAEQVEKDAGICELAGKVKDRQEGGCCYQTHRTGLRDAAFLIRAQLQGGEG